MINIYQIRKQQLKTSLYILSFSVSATKQTPAIVFLFDILRILDYRSFTYY